MNFELTDEQKEVKNAAREFAEKEFSRELALECEEQGRFPHGLWKKAADLGFIGINIPEEYGGQGMGLLEKVLVLEEFFRADPSLGFIYITTFGSELILNNGTEEQKKRYLPAVCRGEMRMGVAITEPDAGSDVASISTRAERRGDHYVISGNKIFITNATVADFLIVACVTNPEAPKKHERLSLIIVETSCPGYEATKLKGKLSIRCSDTGEVALKEVVVPKENLLGEEGKGFYYLMEFFNRTRAAVGALGVGTAQGALDKAISHVRQRKQFGRPLAAFDSVQHKIAEMATLVEAARSLVWRAASEIDRGNVDPALIAIAKWYACEVAVRVADEAVQLHGGYGILEEYDVAHYYRDAKVLEIFEGTKEIEKILIARRLLGRY